MGLGDEIGGFFGSLFTGGAANIIETVGNVVDKFHTSDEQRISLENEMRRAEMSYKAEMKSLDIKETGLLLADTDSARDNQSRIQESENSSWMAKNIQSFLAIMVIVVTFVMFGLVLFGTVKESTITMMILGSLVTIDTQIVSYFFGASRDTGENNKKISQISEMITRTK